MGVSVSFAQDIEPQQEVNIDDLGTVSDAFQEHFFTALQQKAITNYDKAIEALEQCIAIDAKPAYLYFEMGKNYLALKNYEAAERNFVRVLEDEPNKRHVLELLFETYFVERKYTDCVVVMEKLVPFNAMYKEQLANLYFLENRYEDALNAVDELDAAFGDDKYRQKLRRRILQRIDNPDAQIAKLKKKIEKQPKEERHYLNLIYHYSQGDQEEKAFAVAQQLLKQKPDSELVHLALYKFYLDTSKTKDAIHSMKIVLGSDQLDEESKQKVVVDFLKFVEKNPQYESKLTEVIATFSESQLPGSIFTKVGDYFYAQKNKIAALNFYERSLNNVTQDFERLKRILMLQMDLGRYEKAKYGSEMAIEVYPSQSILYYINGSALLQLQRYEETIEILDLGVDYIIEDPTMEFDFYTLFGKAYQKMGNTNKATQYQKKAEQIHEKS